MDWVMHCGSPTFIAGAQGPAGTSRAAKTSYRPEFHLFLWRVVLLTSRASPADDDGGMMRIMMIATLLEDEVHTTKASSPKRRTPGAVRMLNQSQPQATL